MSKKEFETEISNITSLIKEIKEVRTEHEELPEESTSTREKEAPEETLLTEQEEKLLSNITSKINSLRHQVLDNKEHTKKLNLAENELAEWIAELVDPVLNVIEEEIIKTKENQQDFTLQISDLKNRITEFNETLQNYLKIPKKKDEHEISITEEKMKNKINNFEEELKDLNKNTKTIADTYQTELKEFQQLISDIAQPFNESTTALESFKKIFEIGSRFEEEYNTLKKNIDTGKLLEDLNPLKDKLDLSQAERKSRKIKHEADQTLANAKPQLQILKDKLDEIKKDTSLHSNKLLRGEEAKTALQSKPEADIEIFQKKLKKFIKELSIQVKSIKNSWKSFQKELPFSPDSKPWNDLQKEIELTQSAINELESYQDETEASVRQFQGKIKDIEEQLEFAKKIEPLIKTGKEIDNSIKKDISLFQNKFNYLKNSLREAKEATSVDIELNKILTQLDELNNDINNSTQKHDKDYDDFKHTLAKGKKDKTTSEILEKELSNLADSVFYLKENGAHTQKQIQTLKKQARETRLSYIILPLEKKSIEHQHNIEEAISNFETGISSILKQDSLFAKNLLKFSDTEFHKIYENIKILFKKLNTAQNNAQKETKDLELRFNNLRSKQNIEDKEQKKLVDNIHDLNEKLSKINQFISKTESAPFISPSYREEQITKHITQLEDEFSKNILAVKSRLPSSFAQSLNTKDEKLVELDIDNFKTFLKRLEIMNLETNIIKENLEKTCSFMEKLVKTYDLLDSKEHKDVREKVNDWHLQLYSERKETLIWWDKQKEAILSKLAPSYWKNRRDEALELKEEIISWDPMAKKIDALPKEYQKEIKNLKEVGETDWEHSKNKILYLGRQHVEFIKESIETIESFQKRNPDWFETTIKNYIDTFCSQRKELLSKIEAVKNLKIKKTQSQPLQSNETKNSADLITKPTLEVKTKLKSSKNQTPMISNKKTPDKNTEKSKKTGSSIFWPLLGTIAGGFIATSIALLSLPFGWPIPITIAISAAAIAINIPIGTLIGFTIGKRIEKNMANNMVAEKNKNTFKKDGALKQTGPSVNKKINLKESMMMMKKLLITKNEETLKPQSRNKKKTKRTQAIPAFTHKEEKMQNNKTKHRVR